MSKISDFIRKAKNTTCSVVVVAAGSSTRMGEDKILLRGCSLLNGLSTAFTFTSSRKSDSIWFFTFCSYKTMFINTIFSK